MSNLSFQSQKQGADPFVEAAVTEIINEQAIQRFILAELKQQLESIASRKIEATTPQVIERKIETSASDEALSLQTFQIEQLIKKETSALKSYIDESIKRIKPASSDESLIGSAYDDLDLRFNEIRDMLQAKEGRSRLVETGLLLLGLGLLLINTLMLAFS